MNIHTVVMDRRKIDTDLIQVAVVALWQAAVASFP